MAAPKRTILITGATGLIGSRVCSMLLERNYPVLALVRDRQRAKRILGEHPLLTLQQGDITTPFLPDIPVGAIVHGANPTASKAFLNDPVGTIDICTAGTKNLLDLARFLSIEKFVYLSSNEVYGFFPSAVTVREDRFGSLDPMLPRSSYAQAKRLCESLCCAYAAQYGVPAVVARLGIVFGPVTDDSDNRLIAQFLRCVNENRNIVLQTSGGTVRSYCHVDDAVRAIFCLLDQGVPGMAYNVANPELTFSVLELAQRVCKMFPHLSVQINDTGKEQAQGYLPEMKMCLDVSRMQALGWAPLVGFEEGFLEMIAKQG